MTGCVLCMQIKKLKLFRSGEVGGCKAECAEWHQFLPENADSGGIFAKRSMDVIGRPSIATPAHSSAFSPLHLLRHCFDI